MTTPKMISSVVIEPRPTTSKDGITAFINEGEGITFAQEADHKAPGQVVFHPDELEELLPHIPGLIAAARMCATHTPGPEPKVDFVPE